VTDSELHLFFEDLVRELRSRGVVSAITSWLACVHCDRRSANVGVEIERTATQETISMELTWIQSE
jgi:hypothetical protein